MDVIWSVILKTYTYSNYNIYKMQHTCVDLEIHSAIVEMRMNLLGTRIAAAAAAAVIRTI